MTQKRREQHVQPVVEIIEPSQGRPSDFAGDTKSGHVHIVLSKRFLWSLAITLVIAALGLSAWQFGWYKKALDTYNMTSYTLKVSEGEKYALPGAAVVIEGSSSYSKTSDDNGKVSIERIVAGDYTLKITKDGYTPLEKRISIVRGDNAIGMYSLEKIPDKVFSVKGTVKDYVGEDPLTNVQVTMKGKTVETDPSGSFSFTDIPAGEVTVTFAKSGYLNNEQKVTLSDKDAAGLAVALVPSGQVVFVSNRDGKRALYTTNYDGSGQRQLVAPANGGEDFAPQLSPDGRSIAFSSTRDGIKSSLGSPVARLYIVDRDGKNLRKVSDDVGHGLLKWAPSSRYLYFEAFADVQLTNYVRRFYDVEKSALIDLGEDASGVVFNTSGSAVAYSVHVKVPVATPEPTATSVVSPSPAVSPQASPSPTATPSATTEDRIAVEVLTLASGGKVTIAQKTVSFIDRIGFTADGKQVAFETMIGPDRHRFQVNLSDLRENEVALQSTDANPTETASSDGKQLAYIEERDGKTDLFVSASTGSDEKRLTTLGVVNVSVAPLWDASNLYLVIAVQRQGENAFYVVSTKGGQPKKVTDFLDDRSGSRYGYY